MALPETYYAVHTVDGSLPESSEWYSDIDTAKRDAVEMAEDDAHEPYAVSEVMVRPLYRTELTVTLEKL
jgi:hypothetical protein